MYDYMTYISVQDPLNMSIRHRMHPHIRIGHEHTRRPDGVTLG